MVSALLDAQAEPAAWLALLLLKVTVLLAAAWLLYLALRGVNPRWRVLLWRAVSVGTLLLFGLALCPPLLNWAVLPPERMSEVAQGPEPAPSPLAASEPAASCPTSPETRDAGDVFDKPIVPATDTLAARAEEENLEALMLVGSDIEPAMVPPAEAQSQGDGGTAPIWIWLITWCFGASACLLYRLAGLWHLTRTIRRATSVPEWVGREATIVAEGLGIRRSFAVRQSAVVSVPCLASILRPMVLLPRGQCREEYREELPSILAHELAHLRAGDLAWSHLLYGLSVLLWFHPLAWWMAKVHGGACDAVCDAVAADYVGDAHTYGRTLARLALRAAGPAVGLAMAGKSNVRRRVEAVQRCIFRAGLPRGRAWLALTLSGGILLALGGLALTRSELALADAPTKAAESDKAEDAAEAPEQAVLTVRCVTSAGHPMEGVELRFHGRIGGEIVNHTLHTDQEGIAHMERPAAAAVQNLWMTAKKPKYTAIHYTWRSERRTIELPERLDLAFEEAITIGGVVKNEAGQPIAGATIDFRMPISWPRLANYVFEAGERKTDEDGRWTWDSAPKGLGASMDVTHPNYLRAGMHPAATMDNEIVLRQGQQVTGRVLNGAGEPIQGATAQLGFDRFGTGEPKATSDADGQFVIVNCKTGRSAVTVQAEGMAPQVKELTVGGETKPLEFRLEPGHLLHGRVVDVEGQPIEGALVAPDTWRGFRTLERRMITDAEGRFEWRGAPPDAVEYSILKQGHMAKRDFILIASEEEQVVTLYPELEIHGRVTDAVTGKPIPEFRIQRGHIQNNRETVYWTRDEGVLYKDGQYSYKIDEPMKGWLLQATAPGYLPATSRTFESTEGQQTFDFALQPSKGLSGLVLLPGGEPAEGATVGLASEERRASLKEGRWDRSQNSAELVTTDAAGRFSFPLLEEPFLLIAVHDQGYGELTHKEFAESKQIKLQAWGRLEGKVVVGDKADAGREVSFQLKRPERPRMGMPVWNYGYQTKTDDDGRFQFERVIPGPGSLSRVVVTKMDRSEQHTPCWQTPVEIKEGKTTETIIGGTGRPVLGRIVLDRQPDAAIDWTTNEPVTLERWDKASAKRTEIYARYAGNIDKAGQFIIPDVPAGDYRLSVPVNLPPTPNACGAGNAIGRAELEFSVPEMPGGRSDQPLELGTIEAKLFDTLDVGELAPEFVANNLNGEPFRLQQYRGKLILLNFWATWCKPCLAEFPLLEEIHGAYGEDDRFVMVSVSCDYELAAARHYLEQNGLPWQQVHVPGTGVGAPKQYSVRSLPAVFLIAPDGTVLAKNLQGTEWKDAVGKALATDSLFDVKDNVRAERFPVTRFNVDEKETVTAPAVVVLEDTDPNYDTSEPRHDVLRALSASGEELWKHADFNTCQAGGDPKCLIIDRQRKRIYVAENVGGKIHAFTFDGQRTWQIDHVEVAALALDEKTGDIWSSGGPRLNAGETVVFDPQGKEKTSFLHRAIDMAYDPHSDSFWLVGYEILNLSRTGEIRFREKVEGWSLGSVSINRSNGSLWTMERDHPDIPRSKNRLWLRGADGSVRQKIELGERDPFAVACDAQSGDGWLAFYGSGLQRYSTDGELVAELPYQRTALALSPTTHHLWLAAEEETICIDASGNVLARSPHGKPTKQVWIAAF